MPAPLMLQQAQVAQQAAATCRLLPVLVAPWVVPCVFLRVNPRAQAAMFGCLAVLALHLAVAAR